MDRTQVLWEILEKDYGITTIAQLNAAIETQKRLDISCFCGEVKKNGFEASSTVVR